MGGPSDTRVLAIGIAALGAAQTAQVEQPAMLGIYVLFSCSCARCDGRYSLAGEADLCSALLESLLARFASPGQCRNHPRAAGGYYPGDSS